MLAKALGTLAFIYIGMVVAGYLGQRRLIYIVDPVHVSPEQAGLEGVSEVTIPAPDGSRVLAWYAPALPGRKTILYFHGNGGSLNIRAPRIERFMGEGLGVFMMTYRGYGGSTGQPTEVNNVADAIRAFDTLVAKNVAARDIVIYGESLGTGVATQVALARPSAAGLILDAPFTSVPDIAARGFWFLPVRALITDRYDTAHRIGGLKMPLLILHGRRDGTVPVDMGRTLAKLAPEPKAYVEFPNGGHSDLYINGNDALSAVRNFIATLH